MPDPAPDLSRLRIERTPPARGGRAGWIVALLLLIALAAHVVWREGLLAGSRPGVAAEPEVTLSPVGTGASLQPASGTAANGYVVARTRAALSTDIQGRITEMHVEEGDRVQAGDVVARLDTRGLEASLAQAKANVVEAEAAAELAELELQRLEALVPTGDAQVSERDAARAARDEARARLEALGAQVSQVQVMLDKSTVYAPFDGVITAKDAEVGEVVAALGATGPDARGAVATLVDFETLEVQVELAQTSLSAARVGAPVRIFLDAWPDDPYPGKVRAIWPTANRQKATVEVRVVFLERDDRILPEMGVRVVFLEQAPETSDVFVPQRAVRTAGDEMYVMLYEDGHASRRTIRAGGETVGGQLPVAEGLSGSELVIVDGPPDLADGDAVRPRKDG
jgi:RND family efflux transporter MFP subunit